MMKKFILAATALVIMNSCCTQQENTAPVEVNKQEIVVENILNRRSVRNYTDVQVTQAQLETLMQCAINAPSAMNRQPWQVRVVQEANILDKIRAVNEKTIYNAPTVIFIAKDTENRYSDFDCGLLTQNILLAAESMDLGTVVVGSVTSVLNVPEGKEIVESLDLPENYEVIVGICLGNKNEHPDARPRDAEKVKYFN
ncbi:MAG: nitroreductase family protein [Tannerellaceae bacterium]|nr:nitroreductase family protein [Tannerellaceae bacterium]